MRAGRLHIRLALLAPEEIQTPTGLETQFVPAGSVWAALEQAQVKEIVRGTATIPERQRHFRIRYRRGVSSDMRVIHDGLTFEITQIIDPNVDRQRRELLLICKEA